MILNIIWYSYNIYPYYSYSLGGLQREELKKIVNEGKLWIGFCSIVN